MSEENQQITVCFFGDSGDGMQLIGEQFSATAIRLGCDISTLPDFPAEIRAPVGTVSGVSGFNLSFSKEKKLDEVGIKADVIVAMNPAALKKALPFANDYTLFILNEDSFAKKDYKKAGLNVDEALLPKGANTKTFAITKQTQIALSEFEISNTQSKKSKNFYVLGLLVWLFDFPIHPILNFIETKFKDETLKKVNLKAFDAGFNFADISELEKIDVAWLKDLAEKEAKGNHMITGTKAAALALASQASLSKTKVFIAGYPITPASPILQEAMNLNDFGVIGFQAEDELAAINAALGAAFAGSIALTVTSGPGMSLKGEALGLAVISELPLVVINVQRAGPSTGLPTKTEQSDLMQALYGRHGEAPLAVIAPTTPKDCFYGLLDAIKIAVDYMTPVIFLMDAFLANNANRWQIPDLSSLLLARPDFNRFSQPFSRDEKLARNWPIPGDASQIHQLGGLEKKGESGAVSYDANNHQAMIKLRAKKIENIKIAKPYIHLGYQQGEMLLVSWGSTYGAVKATYETLKAKGLLVSFLHLRLINPLPKALADIFKNHEKIWVCELNDGQLCQHLRATFLVDAKSINQCSGRAFSSESLLKKLYEGIDCANA